MLGVLCVPLSAWDVDVLREGESAIGYLATVGRATGRPHRVPLRLVCHGGKLYASRRDAASDWCRNLIRNPEVTVHLRDEVMPATARLLDDDDIAARVSSLKYGDERSLKKRVIVEIVPYDPGHAPGKGSR